MPLTQTQLATAVADRAELSKADAKRALATLEEIVLEQLGNAEKVRIGGIVQMAVGVKPAQNKRKGGAFLSLSGVHSEYGEDPSDQSGRDAPTSTVASRAARRSAAPDHPLLRRTAHQREQHVGLRQRACRCTHCRRWSRLPLGSHCGSVARPRERDRS